jgi:putative nucleotidyltransferase with HDIG domain
MSYLNDILKNVEHIPPFSEVAQKAMKLLQDPEVTARELADVIQYDASLTADILKICNSPYYGIQRKISSVNDAVVVIGHSTLKDVIMTCSASKYYKGDAAAGYGHEQGDLWKHSVGTAIMAKLLVKHVQGIDAGTAYTTGLMHDVGKLILSNFVSEEFGKIVEKVRNEKYSFTEAEMEILGATHAEIGARVLEKWNFPHEMVLAVKDHHDPDVLKKEPLSALVALSNILVVIAGVGSGAGGLATKIHGEGLQNFGIGTNEADQMLVEWLAEFNEAQELVNL